MRMRSTRCLWAPLLALIGSGFTGEFQPAVARQSEKRLTLERLYSLPRLIGTAPRGFAWSRDSRALAFLWNAEGTNFHDLWMIRVEQPEPIRLTRLARTSPTTDRLDEIATREQNAGAEQDQGATSLNWHPDGRRLLFTFRGDLYLVDPDSQPVRVTNTPTPEQQASFSPDGQWLSYIRNGDVWIQAALPTGSSEPRRLTKVAGPNTGITSYAWSPVNGSLAVVETDRRRVPVRDVPDYLADPAQMVQIQRPYPGEPSGDRRLGIATLATGDIEWIDLAGNREDPIHSFRWSPNGARLLVDTSDLYVKDRRLLIVEAATRTIRQLHREMDPRNVTAQWAAEWGPEGRGVYFISDRHQDYHIYLLDEGGGEPRRITQGEWAVSDLHVPTTGNFLFFEANEGRPEERHLYRIGLRGESMTRVSGRAGTHTATVSHDGKFAAVNFSSDDVPPDLFLTALDAAVAESARERQITRSPLPVFHEYRWTKAQYITFPNHRDGVTLHGRLLVGPDLDRARKHPAIIGSIYSNTVRNRWGGGTSLPTWGIDQYFVQEGYVVLNIDIRGSGGHGKEFRQGIRLDYGGVDVEDVYSGLLYLKSLSFVDTERIGIWGTSYGGLLTTMSLFKRPGAFRAGVAGAPATNVWHALTGEMRVMMRPQDQPREYDNASSFGRAASLQDPLMIIHGMRDRIVLFQDSVSLVQRLIMFDKKDVELVVLPDAEHAWPAGPLHEARFAFGKLAAHFDRHLGKGPR
jgi:dipeptidyl-peptidase 4